MTTHCCPVSFSLFFPSPSCIAISISLSHSHCLFLPAAWLPWASCSTPSSSSIPFSSSPPPSRLPSPPTKLVLVSHEGLPIHDSPNHIGTYPYVHEQKWQETEIWNLETRILSFSLKYLLSIHPKAFLALFSIFSLSASHIDWESFSRTLCKIF